MTTVKHLNHPEYGLNVDVYENLFGAADCERIFTTLNECFYRHISLIKHAKDGQLPHKRINLTYGNEGQTYTLNFKDHKSKDGGKITIKRDAIAWNDCPLLEYVRDAIGGFLNEKFTFCVVQRYVDGNIWIHPHRDTEMRPGTKICGLSLGATRTLSLSRNGFTDINVPLPPGSMYVFNPPTNDYWRHCILKEPHINDIRISLTFRTSAS